MVWCWIAMAEQQLQSVLQVCENTWMNRIADEKRVEKTRQMRMMNERYKKRN